LFACMYDPCSILFCLILFFFPPLKIPYWFTPPW
jgi:hypothetical protein